MFNPVIFCIFTFESPPPQNLTSQSAIKSMNTEIQLKAKMEASVNLEIRNLRLDSVYDVFIHFAFGSLFCLNGSVSIVTAGFLAS